MTLATSEPRRTLARRTAHRLIEPGRQAGRALGGLLLILIVGGSLMVISGINPIEGFQGLWRGSFGSTPGIGSAVLRSTPVILTGLGVAVAYRAGVFNVGAEGQLFVGGLCGTMGALVAPDPAVVNIAIALAAGFVGGALWSGIPGYLKAYRGVNEIISTVLLNFVAIQMVAYATNGPLEEPDAISPQSERLPHDIPVLIPDTSSHYGFVLAVGLTVLVWWYTTRTHQGLRMRAVGGNPLAARYAGVNDRRSIVWAMLISGGLAGLGGAVEVLGLHHRLYPNFSPGFGFEGLIAAILANGDAITTTVYSTLIGGLRSGGEEMQRSTGVPIAFVFIIQGLIFLVIAGSRARQRQPAAPAEDSPTESDAASSDRSISESAESPDA